MIDPAISIVVPTRERPEDAEACARAIALLDGPPFELLFIDQSEGDATRLAIERLADPRIRLVRCDARGASAGRNEGIALARGAIVALTDDDCRPAPDWLARIAARFAGDDALDLLCGRVRAPELLAEGEFAASFAADPGIVCANLEGGMGALGLSANMAVRRAALARLGPFDEALSPGTDLRAGEDFDWIIRAARAGLVVRNDPSIEVLHLGVRRGDAVRALRLGYHFATGACFSKHVRAGDPVVRRLFVGELARGVSHIVASAVRGRRPLGVGWLATFARGAAASFRYGVAPERRLFLDRHTGAPVRARR
jgi:glycosyltransferase involved in cell wall biosynthesis